MNSNAQMPGQPRHEQVLHADLVAPTMASAGQLDAPVLWSYDVPVTWIYDVRNPLAIKLGIHPPGQCATWWTMARDLIAATVQPGSDPVGEGDVQWTTYSVNPENLVDPENPVSQMSVGDSGNVTVLSLFVDGRSSGWANVIFQTDAVIEFIEATVDLVQIGAEKVVEEAAFEQFLADLSQNS